MKRTKFLISLGVITTLVLTLVLVITAQAGSPDHEDTLIDEISTVEGSEEHCGYKIKLHTWGTWSYDFYFDNESNLVKVLLICSDWNKTWTGPSGKTIKLHVHGPAQWRVEKDWSTVISKSIGVNQYVVLPGYGPVYGYAGQIIFDEFTGITLKEVGKVMDPPKWDAICEYFK